MSLRHGGAQFTGAPPSLEASNQAQIDDLVQRNRTLEHTNKKLAEQVALEQARTRDAVVEIQNKWEANQQLWKEGCEAVLSSYRIVQKKLEIEVETERAAIIKEMAITREEKLQRIQRDVKIKRFQMREEELESRIEELEEGRASLAEAAEHELEEEREKTALYASKLKEIRESSKLQLDEVRSALKRAKQEKDDKEARYTELASKYAVLEGKFDTLETKFEKTKLQLEGSQTKITEIQRLNDELTRSNASLNNQLERWQNLENKGGEAAEQQRKKVVALELQLRELQAEHEQETEKAEKAKKRIENLKNTSDNWENQAKNHEKETNDIKKQLAKLQKVNDKLKADLEEERARVRPPTPQKSRKPTSPPPDNDDEVDEIEEDEAPEEPVARKKKSSSKATTTKPGPSTLAEESDSRSKPFKQIAKKSTGGKPPRPRKSSPPSDQEVVEISNHEIEEEPAPTKKRKAKAKAVEPEEIEEDDAPAPPPASRKQNGKRRATEDDDSNVPEIVEKPKGGKRGSRAPSEVRDTTAAKTRGKRAGSKQPATRTEPHREEEDEDQVVPKKKRKILPLIAPGPFAFGALTSLAQFDDNGLGIPSTLSPLKQDERVPHRSTSSNLVSSFGNFVKGPLSGLRKP